MLMLCCRRTLLTASMAVLLMLACIPPPAASEPPAPEPAAQNDPGQAILDSVSFLTTTLPVPQIAPLTTTFVESIIQAFDVSVEIMVAPDPADGEEHAPVSGTQLVDTAYQYHGVRYRWAGMSSRGMDCSGLIARVLRHYGIRVPHNAAQLFQLGRPVAYEELQPGDLLFFNTVGRRISHVGMYVGNNEFIHASSSAGRVVTTSLDDPYYSNRLKGARRLGAEPETYESYYGYSAYDE